MKKINWNVFIGFLLSSFLFRFWSFFRSVIDRDESLYILVAHSFVNGEPPYVEVWDNKPPGIFMLFSLAIFIFGDSVVSIRILACLSIAITSYFLYKIGRVIGKDGEKIGLLAGILYLVFSLQNDGIAANAEILFAPFVTLAFFLLFRATEYSRFTSFMIGLFIGFGMQIKYVVFMDFLALLVIGSIHTRGNKNTSGLNKIFRFYTVVCLGFVLPFVIIALYFISLNYFNEYIYATLIANLKYIDTTEFSLAKLLFKFGEQIYSNFFLYLCLFLCPIYIKFSKILGKQERRNLIYLLCWFGFTFIATLLSKRFTDHYFLQLLPPLCLISSCIIIKTVYRQITQNMMKRNIILLTLIIVVFLQIVYPQIQTSKIFITNRYIKGKDNWGDKEAIVANYIKAKVNRSDYIYVANYQPIIYYLVQAKLPTKYVFPSHLISNYSTITGVEPVEELHSIMNKKPRYVIVDEQREIDEEYEKALYGYLNKDYVLEKSIENVKLYRLKRIL